MEKYNVRNIRRTQLIKAHMLSGVPKGTAVKLSNALYCTMSGKMLGSVNIDPEKWGYSDNGSVVVLDY